MPNWDQDERDWASANARIAELETALREVLLRIPNDTDARAKIIRAVLGDEPPAPVRRRGPTFAEITAKTRPVGDSHSNDVFGPPFGMDPALDYDPDPYAEEDYFGENGPF